MTATVVLAGPAPAGGVVVNLSASSAVAQVPASVAIPRRIKHCAIHRHHISGCLSYNGQFIGRAKWKSSHRNTHSQSSGILGDCPARKTFQIDGTLTISGTALRFEIQAVPSGSAHLIMIDDELALPSYPQLLVQYTAMGNISGNAATFSSTSVSGLYQADPAKFASLNSGTLVINFTSSSPGSQVTGTLTLSASTGTVQATFTGNLTAIG